MPEEVSRKGHYLRLLLRTGLVGLAAVTAGTVVGSIFYPEWWSHALWKGGLFNVRYLGDELAYLLDNELLIAFCAVLVLAAAAICLYFKRRWLNSFVALIDRIAIPAVIACLALLILTGLYLRQGKYRDPTLLDQAMAGEPDALKWLQSLEPKPRQFTAPIDFLYIDRDRVNGIYSEIQPALIEIQRMTSSSVKAGGTASVSAGPASISGDVTREGIESSKYEKSEGSAERKCIAIMNATLKDGSGHYYTTAQNFYTQQIWTDAVAAGRKGYEEAEKGYNPVNYAPIQPLSEERDKPSREQRLASETQLSLWFQQFHEEARGFVVVDGQFHVTRGVSDIVFEEEFSPPPRKSVFRFSIPIKFDTAVFQDGVKMQVFGAVVPGSDSPATLTIDPLAVFAEPSQPSK